VLLETFTDRLLVWLPIFDLKDVSLTSILPVFFQINPFFTSSISLLSQEREGMKAKN
jgi:hypothetical protein